MLDAVRQECARRLPPEAMDGPARRVLDAGRRRGRDRRRAARPARNSRSRNDPPLRRRSGAAGSRARPAARSCIDGDRIVEIGGPIAGDGALRSILPDHYIVPGFIDVHVHGIEGTDTLDGGGAIATMAERLPRYGVTAFCPTSIACDPPALRGMLSRRPARPRRRVRPAARACCRRISRATSSTRTSRARSRSTACAPPRRQTRVRPLAGPAHVRSVWRATTSSTRSPRRGPTSASSPSRRRLDGALDLIRDLVVARPSRVARALRRDLRTGAGGHPRRRAAGDASLQPHAAARPSRARTRRGGARVATTWPPSSSATASTCIPR